MLFWKHFDQNTLKYFASHRDVSWWNKGCGNQQEFFCWTAREQMLKFFWVHPSRNSGRTKLEQKHFSIWACSSRKWAEYFPSPLVFSPVLHWFSLFVSHLFLDSYWSGQRGEAVCVQAAAGGGLGSAAKLQGSFMQAAEYLHEAIRSKQPETRLTVTKETIWSNFKNIQICCWAFWSSSWEKSNNPLL